LDQYGCELDTTLDWHFANRTARISHPAMAGIPDEFDVPPEDDKDGLTKR